MDIARLGLAVDSSQVDRGTANLHQFVGASGAAEKQVRSFQSAAHAALASVRGLGDAVGAGLRAAYNAAGAALQKFTSLLSINTAAQAANEEVTRQAAATSRNLMFQMVDIGQSIPLLLQSPVHGLQNLGFQFAQIGQLYWGNGGMGAALKDMGSMLGGALTRMAPLAAALGVVAAGIAGLTYEINKTAAVQVSFFDVALAGWQLFAEAIGSGLAPAWNGIVTGLQWVWDQLVPILKRMGNGIIAPFAFGVKAIGTLWTGLPSAIGDVMITTANVIVKGIEWSINGATRLLNGFLEKYNEGLTALGQQTIPLASGITIPQAANPYQGMLGQLGANLDANSAEAYTTDYMGDMFGAISERAQQIAGAKQEVEGLGGAAQAANDNLKTLADDGLQSVADKAFNVAEGLRSALQGIGSGLFDAIKQGGDIAGSVLDMLMDKLSQFASSWLDNIVNNGIDALFGGMGNIFGGMGSGMGGISSVDPYGSSGMGYFPGFDGGGYTGSGGRYGGLDGKGGFLAMMHPQESVIDHTRPANQNFGGANQNRPVNFQTNIINNAGVEVVERSSDDGQGGVRQEIVLNRAVANAIGKPGPAQRAVRQTGRLVTR